MLQIKRSGWMYRIAYGLTDKDKRPDKINLCRFFWRFFFMLFVGVPFFYIFTIFVTIVADVGLFVLCGRYLSYAKMPGEMIFMRPFTEKEYDKIPTIKGRKCTPILLIFVGLLLWFLHEKGSIAASKAAYVISISASVIVKIVTGLMFWKWVGSIVGCIILILLAVGFFKSEPWHLFCAWSRAKKEKACPIIKVVQ